MTILPKALVGILSGVFTLTALAADKIQTEGATPGQWTMDFDAATKMAAEKKLPLLLNFTGSDWCSWCKLMDEEVFAKEDWKKFAADNTMLVTLDFPEDEKIVPAKYKARNEMLKEQFHVGGYPTYIILDSDGKTVLGQLGAGRDKTPSSFIEEFKAAVKLSATNVAAYIKANPDKADAFKAAIAESRDADKALDDWIATRPERNEENTKLFEGFKARINAANEKLGEFE
ncbi:MAG: thioredoxin family protein [Verrucomicrobia bacterium]|nr:thioredoxin family protein [Verrucomicrobiota bacterium]